MTLMTPIGKTSFTLSTDIVAEMPRFEGEEYHNVYQEDGSTAFTDEYK
jgi:hypothetical protein